MDARHLTRELWRWYILLLIANELDLAYTYVGLSRGAFLEGNLWLGHLLLPGGQIPARVTCRAGLLPGSLVLSEQGLPRRRASCAPSGMPPGATPAGRFLHIGNCLP